MRRFRPHSLISLPLVFAMLALQGGLLLAGLGVLHVAMDARDAEETRRDLERFARLLTSQAHHEGPTAVADSQSSSGGPLQRGDIRAKWISEEGTVLADSHVRPQLVTDQSGAPEFRAALQEERGFAIRRSSTFDQRIAAYAIRLDPPVMITDRPARVLTLSRAMSPPLAAAEWGHARWLMLAAVLVGPPGIAWAASRRLRRTINPITEGARRFAAGEFTRRIARPRVREAVDLADALNVAAAGLDRQISLLQRQRNEQRIILQSMSNAVVALDLDHRILSLNAAAERMLRLNGETARGRLLQEVVRQPALNRFVSRTISEGSRERDEIDLEGEPRLVVEATSEALKGPTDRPVGVLILLNDVTKLRRLESLRSDFAANVSHELRTPITNIKGYVETLLDVGTEDPQQTRRFLEIIKGNSDRLASIIEDLLALARLEQPDTRQTLTMSEITVASVCAEVVGSLATVARAKGIALDTDVDRRLRFCVNRQLIEQALGNLVSNAIKYSPAHSTITLTARPGDVGRVMLEVRDEGAGIATEHLPRLFERFYRIDKARSREMGGTGLGLAIVKHIALVHGGTVDVETEIGKGSTFRLTLPAAAHATE